jgi:hypothetical protein
MLSTKAPLKSVSAKDIKEDKVVKTEKEVNKTNDNGTVVNIINQTVNNSILIEHNESEGKFILKSNGTIIGYFTVDQILKYLNQDIEGYLLSVELSSAQRIIEEYLLKIDISGNYILVSHLSSPITGNIDILVKIYKDIQKSIENTKSELEKVDDKSKEIIMHNNNKLIYELLTQIIKLFTVYSNTVNETKITPALQTSILKYTAGAVYRLSSMLKDELDSKIQKILKFNSELDELQSIRKKYDEKISSLESSIEIQNKKIDQIIKNINEPKLDINEPKIDIKDQPELKSQDEMLLNFQNGGYNDINSEFKSSDKKTLSSITSAINSSMGGISDTSTMKSQRRSIRLSSIIYDNDSDNTFSFRNHQE